MNRNSECGSAQQPTGSSIKQPIRARYLGHVIGYQPIRDQYFLVVRDWITIYRRGNKAKERSDIDHQS